MVQKERKSEGRGLNPLWWLELVKKFLVVVVVCKPILVFSLGFDQSEQLWNISANCLAEDIKNILADKYMDRVVGKL